VTNVVLADDHLIVLDGLQRLLEAESDCTVVATCRTAEAALDACGREPVDILITDLRMPAMGGIELLRQVAARHPAIRTVVLTADLGEEDAAAALRHGVKGIVLKEEAPSVLSECLRVLAAGGTWLADAHRARGEAGAAEGGRPVDEALLALLTPREVEIARFVSRGLRSKDIGIALGISPGTVKIHLHRIYTKLQISTRIELANIVQGLPPPA
jgi:DNA-binding NarL/FixJ family response regulator